ncbi:hypothetical protein [Sphaerospermopsis aphanizomenoides]|uniref:hypothetical protein n=1 Tax=Sphaerospermopsis aphanizomenoides TaxID=459663 RepID=UPI001F269442|nr:hypothetical protein [Sphaerospermopsis aphanizomenoides]
MNYLSEQNKLLDDIHHRIRQTEHELLKAIQIVIDNKALYGDVEEYKFRNLLRVSETTESLEVIKNYLRYELGREKKWGTGENSLSATIIKDIDGKIKEIAQKIEQEVQFSDFNLIWLELIRRYFGYGVYYAQFINSSHLIEIEQSVSRLSREEQLWLVDRIIHNMKLNTMREIANKRASHIPNLTHESIEQQLANMANDPAIQAEIAAINQEFANTEMDGLGDQ